MYSFEEILEAIHPEYMLVNLTLYFINQIWVN